MKRRRQAWRMNCHLEKGEEGRTKNSDTVSDITFS